MGGGGVWDPAAQGYLQQTGGDLQWHRGNFTVPQKPHGAQQVVVPPKKSLVWHWWRCLGCSLAADRCKWPWRVAVQVHPGWFWGTRLILTYTNSGESQALCSDKAHLCPGEHNTWSPSWEDPCAAPLWACTARHRVDTRADGPNWGSCEFHLTKMFPWSVSSSHSSCRGLPPCQVQSPICLLWFQMLAARQAKGALSSTCYLEVLSDECSHSRRFVYLVWGERRKGGGSLQPGDEHVAQMEVSAAAGGWEQSPGSHIPPGRSYFYLQTDSSPLGTALPPRESHGPKLQGARGCPCLPTQPASRGPTGSDATVTRLWAGKTPWIQIPPRVRDNVC